MNQELVDYVGGSVALKTAELNDPDTDVNEWSTGALTLARDLLYEVALVNGVNEIDVHSWGGSQGSGKSTVTKGLAKMANSTSIRRMPSNARHLVRMYRTSPIVMGTGGIMASPMGEYVKLTAPVAKRSRAAVEQGELVSDGMAVAAAAMLGVYRLAESGRSNDGWAGLVYDAFPRTKHQRIMWRKFFDNEFFDRVDHQEVMLIPVANNLEVDELTRSDAVEAAKSFARVLRSVGKLDVTDEVNKFELNGSLRVCEILAGGLAGIRHRLIRQGRQGRVDATEGAMVNRISGFFEHTSELWPGSRVINSNQPVQAVVYDAMEVFGFERNDDPRVRKLVNRAGLQAARLVNG